MSFIRIKREWRLALCLGVLSLCYGVLLAEEPVPLARLHAHNDYRHRRPLLDALEHGFCSVEADVHLVDGQLLVAHDRSQVKPGKTLQVLYLDPLRARVKSNSGRVYPGGPEFTLLVELKGDWQTSYPVLDGILRGYADVLTAFRDGRKETNAITVIITGHRSRAMFQGQSVRYAALDGDPVDLDSTDPPTLLPWISANWATSFKWRGTGPFPTPEKLKLKEFVTKAHQQGRKVRFWGAPDQPVFWQEMLDDGVDLINTDDLEGAQKFLMDRANH